MLDRIDASEWRQGAPSRRSALLSANIRTGRQGQRGIAWRVRTRRAIRKALLFTFNLIIAQD
jgi:hypothetical protein